MTATGQVTVDPELCMASGTCLALAPGLFDMGDDGTARPLPGAGAAAGELLTKAMTNCPTGAIRLISPPPT